jgi:hypothetical protein
MTVAGPVAGAAPAGLLARGSAGGDGAARGAPVIVLTYGHAGAWRLQQLLEGQPELACTAGTGMLAACDQAAAAWRQAERPPGDQLSPLASASIRALVTGMITAIVARAGKPRWCEMAAAERSAAETFLQLFPGTRFVCLHRACPDAIYAALQANPWGLSGPGIAAYAAAHPGNRVAALAAWWAGHAGPVLAFEQDHPDVCLRLRYEDLAGDPGEAERGIRKFLGLQEQDASLPELPDGTGGQALAGADAPGCGADLPAGQIPPPLLTQINSLHAKLGYPPLEAAS